MIKNQQEIDRQRKNYCEYCGRSSSQKSVFEVHHIVTKGARGRLDIPENLINLGVYPLCNCHRLAQEYKIPRAELILIVAKREHKTPEEVCKALGLYWDVEKEKLSQEQEEEILEPKEDVTLEQVIAKIIELDEHEKQALFAKGDLLNAAKEVFPDKGFAKFMATQLGCSERYVHEMMKVSKVFPPEKRAMDHSWYLHRLAARTDDPEYWLEIAVNESLSTRQLQERMRAEKEQGDEETEAIKSAERLRNSVKDFIATKGHYAIDILKEIRDYINDYLKEQ